METLGVQDASKFRADALQTNGARAVVVIPVAAGLAALVAVDQLLNSVSLTIRQYRLAERTVRRELSLRNL